MRSTGALFADGRDEASLPAEGGGELPEGHLLGGRNGETEFFLSCLLSSVRVRVRVCVCVCVRERERLDDTVI